MLTRLLSVPVLINFQVCKQASGLRSYTTFSFQIVSNTVAHDDIDKATSTLLESCLNYIKSNHTIHCTKHTGMHQASKWIS